MGIRLIEEPSPPSADPEKIPAKELKELTQLGKILNDLMRGLDFRTSLVIPKHLEIMDSKNINNDLAVIVFNGDEKHIYYFETNGSYLRSSASKWVSKVDDKGVSSGNQLQIKPLPVTKLLEIFKNSKVTTELAKQSLAAHRKQREEARRSREHQLREDRKK